MNILIKLMSIVSLVIAPSLAQVHAGSAPKPYQHKVEQVMEVKVTSNDSTKTADVKVEGNYDALIEAMKKEGLANGENVSVVFKDGKLTINGVEQSKEVVERLKVELGDKMDLNIEVKKETKKQ